MDLPVLPAHVPGRGGAFVISDGEQACHVDVSARIPALLLSGVLLADSGEGVSCAQHVPTLTSSLAACGMNKTRKKHIQNYTFAL